MSDAVPRQILSNSTSPIPGPNRPVNTFPLSVRICSGDPISSPRSGVRSIRRSSACGRTPGSSWFLDYSPEIRKVIYSTNAVESLHA